MAILTEFPSEKHMRKVYAEIAATFPGVRNGGISVCRKIGTTSKWSQHSWGNAVDVMVGSNQGLGDAVFSWVTANSTRLGVGRICWKDNGGCNEADHQDHLHIEGANTWGGIPKCAGGGEEDSKQLGSSDPLLNLPDITAPFDAVADVVGLLTSAQTWLRVMWFVGGAVALSGGVVLFVKELSGVDLAKAAKTIVTKGAA